MIELERIDNLNLAKQALRLLERENARLHRRLCELIKEISKLRGQDATKQLELEVSKLQEHLDRLQRKLFGTSSEKQVRQGAGRRKTAKQKKPQTGHGPRPQPNIPHEEVEHPLEPDERTCDLCGNEISDWVGKSDDYEEITVVHRSFKLQTHKRHKGRCRCNGKVVTAAGPPRLIPGGRYSLEFAIEVAIDKYADGLALARQVTRMAREGLHVTSTVLWDYIEALARHLEASYEGIGEYLLRQGYLHVDETTWRLLIGRPSKKWWLWGAAAAKAVYFWMHPSRSVEAALDFLDAYRGKLIVDGYKVYESLAKAHPTRLWLIKCWSHARRKFFDIQHRYPIACEPILKWIQKIYELEEALPDPDMLSGKARRRALNRRWKVRQRYSRPLVKAIRTWALRQSALPDSALSKAIKYLIEHWHGLTRFIYDPVLPLDNNLIERELRTPVNGRKIHYGSRSERGTWVAAVLYTLIGTARRAGEDPRAYLLRALRAAIKEPGTVTLPHGLEA
jgi:transposase